MNTKILSFTLPIFLAVSLITVTTANAHDDYRDKLTEPVTLLVNFQIASSGVSADSNGTPYYIVGGPGYAPERVFRSGEVANALESDRKIAMLEGAQITFSGQPNDPVVNFTCLAGGCKMKFKDGSVLVSDAGVPLEGRAINMWGPVFQSSDFDPLNGIMPIRIMGCGGLKEIAGKGRLANMVGSVCFNGVLNFNQFDQTQLTGSSKCTITMHTPMDPKSIP